jgi:hypothetical protein
MALTSGTGLGPYEIQSPLGAGGMGEMYRARDTRLERTVAVNVLNAQMVGSAELRARFEREAKVISQLQHPNICVLHDAGNEGPIDYLVMESIDITQKGASLQLGTPHALFKATTVSSVSGPYTVSADGKKFVMNTVPPQSITEPLTLITNWTADLNQ